VLATGGVKKYLEALEENERVKDELVTKELQNIHLEIEDLVGKVADYQQTKGRAIRSEKIAIALIVVTAIISLLQ
jgi:hypothetical protein